MRDYVETTAGELKLKDRFIINQKTTNSKPYVVLGFDMFGCPEYRRADGTVLSLAVTTKVKRNPRLHEILI